MSCWNASHSACDRTPRSRRPRGSGSPENCAVSLSPALCLPGHPGESVQMARNRSTRYLTRAQARLTIRPNLRDAGTRRILKGGGKRGRRSQSWELAGTQRQRKWSGRARRCRGMLSRELTRTGRVHPSLPVSATLLAKLASPKSTGRPPGSRDNRPPAILHAPPPNTAPFSCRHVCRHDTHSVAPDP